MSSFKFMPLLALSLVAAVAAETVPPPLATAAAEYRVVAREFRLDGVVEALHRSTVSAQTQGQVEELHYDVDDYVEKGALLVRLRDTEHRARVSQATAEVRSATATLERVRDEHERIAGLFAKRSVSESAMDAATAELTAVEAALESATARLDQAEEQLAYTRIRAPYSGLVTHRHISRGEMASPGTPLMSGISLDALRVVVDVPQSLIPAVRAGGQALIQLPDGELIEATKITIFPFADMGSSTFQVRLMLPEGLTGLFPGMFVKTRFVVGERRELLVPHAALVQRSEVTGVYVVDAAGRPSLRQIRVGRQVGDQFVVLAGLDEGEHVAVDPIAASLARKALGDRP